jgi:hypothetical protein
MKTLSELFELVAQAVKKNQSGYGSHWFIDYSGHVNKLQVRFYFTGWSTDAHVESVNFSLDEDGIQGAYWFIKTRLK